MLAWCETNNHHTPRKRRVILTRRASAAIKGCVLAAENQYETGGVLIGYQLGSLSIVAAATSSDPSEACSRVSFLLDGEAHTQKAKALIAAFVVPPSLLGIWHSHICDGLTFSRQDRRSNQVFAAQFNGALSMLVTMPADTLLCSTCYISPSGSETPCKTRMKL